MSIKSIYNSNKTLYRKKTKIKVKKLKFFTSITIILLLVFSLAYTKYTSNKCKNLDYAILKYTTSGLFNKYKLYSKPEYKTNFSDGSFAVVEISGIENKAPYKTIKYIMYLKKNDKGTWKVQEYHPSS